MKGQTPRERWSSDGRDPIAACRRLDLHYWAQRLVRTSGLDTLLPGVPVEGGMLRRESLEAGTIGTLA